MEQKIYLDKNGITIKCTPNCKIGYKEFVNGIEYEVVDRELLYKRLRQNYGCASSVCVSLITDMSGMFSETDFNEPIDDWDVSNVTNMSRMFEDSDFNQPINNWDVSRVIYMSNMFSNSKFNQPINNWNVSNVWNMSKMFANSKFNLD